jgi:hypothetical protein
VLEFHSDFPRDEVSRSEAGGNRYPDYFFSKAKLFRQISGVNAIGSSIFSPPELPTRFVAYVAVRQWWPMRHALAYADSIIVCAAETRLELFHKGLQGNDF